jgi:ABC-type lipoprotein release transport system permease subunit
VIGAVFRRPLIQVALGIVAGAALLSTFAYMGALPGAWLQRAAIVIAYSVGMMAVCSLACVVPTWRALRVQPTEALRADG